MKCLADCNFQHGAVYCSPQYAIGVRWLSKKIKKSRIATELQECYIFINVPELTLCTPHILFIHYDPWKIWHNLFCHLAIVLHWILISTASAMSGSHASQILYTPSPCPQRQSQVGVQHLFTPLCLLKASECMYLKTLYTHTLMCSVASFICLD